MPISVSHIVDALSSLGGEAHLDAIVERVRAIAPKPWPASVEASVRGRIQERCAQAKSFKGGEDLFESVHGVEARQGVWRLRSDPLAVSNADSVQDGVEPFIEAPEGRAVLRIHLRRERSRKLIQEFKSKLSHLACAVCSFDFGVVYGELGTGYIEAHHIVPIAELEEGTKTSITDLVPLCANCHRMIHRNGLLSVDDLRRRLASPQVSRPAKTGAP
jgi:putative restriction endonuclease